MKSGLVLMIGMFFLLASIAYGAIIWSDDVSTIFTTTSVLPKCINGEDWQVWDFDLSDLVLIDSENDCYREDVAKGSTQKCCPYGEERCDQVTNQCILPPVDFCENYTTSAECTGDDFGVGVATVERGFGEDWCGKIDGRAIAGITCWWKNIDCRCTWDETSGCISYYNTTEQKCANGTTIPGTGSCELFLIEKLDNCATTGFITFRTKVEWTQYPLSPKLPGADDCVDPPEITYRCPARLSFITPVGIIIAFVLIIVIYIVFYKNNFSFLKKKTNLTKEKTKIKRET